MLHNVRFHFCDIQEKIKLWDGEQSSGCQMLGVGGEFDYRGTA